MNVFFGIASVLTAAAAHTTDQPLLNVVALGLLGVAFAGELSK
jgi:hypothetical protein